MLKGVSGSRCCLERLRSTLRLMSFSLSKHPHFSKPDGPILTVVMDGVGHGRQDEGDAVFAARTPTLDWLSQSSATTRLRAHGLAVGLPSDKDMGNSEVGHNALGAGRVFDQGAKRVQLAVDSLELYDGNVWKSLTQRVREHNSALHFVGLLSDGNVHSHIDHLLSMLRQCHNENIQTAYVHILVDGRDVPETSALTYVDQLEKELLDLREAGRDYWVASGGGRMKVTMDRYGADWAMVEEGFNLHVRGKGRQFPNATTAINTLRDEDPGVIDQFLPGFVISDEMGQPKGCMRDGDACVFFNFRGDRAVEFTQAMTSNNFSHFDVSDRPDVLYAGMMQYDGDHQLPELYLVDPPKIDRTMGQYLAENGIRQFACSETQKFGHVTFFWNGNKSEKFDEKTERYVEVPSDRVAFEQRPWMKAAEITDQTIHAIEKQSFDVGRINYANGDMVGHTGELDAAILAVETVDLCLARLLPVIRRANGILIVTADHGNADQMFEIDKKTGEFATDQRGVPRSKTSHTLNQVPLHIFSSHGPITLRDSNDAGLANLAATTLSLAGFAPPTDYEPSLVE